MKPARPKNLKLEVTQADIDNGIRAVRIGQWRCMVCPIAQCLLRLGYTNPVVSGNRITFNAPGVKAVTEFKPTQVMVNWMRRFDKRGPRAVKPQTFLLTDRID